MNPIAEVDYVEELRGQTIINEPSIETIGAGISMKSHGFYPMQNIFNPVNMAQMGMTPEQMQMMFIQQY